MIYKEIQKAKEKGTKLLAILLDPDKLGLDKIENTVQKINDFDVDYIFVGGSFVKDGISEQFVEKVKQFASIPIVLFPGDYTQITNFADAILFLSLLSGRNPEYLVEQQVKSVPFLKESQLEIIPTGYILIDGGVDTSVQKVSKTTPIGQEDMDAIVNTACAGMYMGNQLIYLEAGSGAKIKINAEIIDKVSNSINIPLIVGGGIRSKEQLNEAYQSGADLVVIGTAFEENNKVLKSILKDESFS